MVDVGRTKHTDMYPAVIPERTSFVRELAGEKINPTRYKNPKGRGPVSEAGMTEYFGF